MFLFYSVVLTAYSVHKLQHDAAALGGKVNSNYTVSTMITPAGERLPMLVRWDSAIPCETVLRWTILERRGHVAASTIVADLRAVQRLYEWAELALDIPLDKHIVEWHRLTIKQIYSLAQYVKTSGNTVIGGSIGGKDKMLTPAAFNHRWRKIELFLRWASQMYATDENGQRGQQQAITKARTRIERLFRQQQVGESVSAVVRVLTSEEWEKVQCAIDIENEEMWPDPSVRFRNHTMIYLAINTGLRVGEVLKLRLDQIPRGHEEHIVVKRNPDDPNDSRAEEPQAKTNERELFVPASVRSALGAYVTRYRLRSRSPYVFLSQDGRPLSLRGARHIVERIGRVANMSLNWHRFRHTFLDRVYESVADEPNGKDLLREIAGWRSETSAEPYVRMQRRRKANEFLAEYQGALFPPAERFNDTSRGERS